MKHEREDWDNPNIPRPARLNQTEAEIIYREINAGASEWRLAEYFSTTITIVRQAYKYMQQEKQQNG